MKCRHCGQEVSADVEYCLDCGKSQKATHVTVETSNRFVMWVWLAAVFSVAALFWWPIVFGGFGIYSGYRAMQTGNEKAGRIMIGVAAVCMVAGLALGFLEGMTEY